MLKFPFRYFAQALVLLGCSTFTCLADEAPVKVGVVYGFSGTANVWADYGRMGLELARDEINAAGGIKGRQLQLVYEDSNSNPAKGVSAMRNLIAEHHPAAVIGDVWSFLTEPLIPVATAEHLTLISPTVMDIAPKSVQPSFYTMGHRMESLEKPIELFFRKNPEVRTAVIFCFPDSWNQAHVRLWKQIAAAHNVTILDVFEEQDFNTNFREAATKAAMKKPDALIVAYGVDRVAARMKERNFFPKILTTSDLVEAVQVRQMPIELASNIYFTNWKPSEEFSSKFISKFGKAPILEADNHYEALRAVGKALSDGSGELSTTLPTIKYQGVTGRIDFSSHPFVNFSEAQLYRVGSDGKFAVVEN